MGRRRKDEQPLTVVPGWGGWVQATWRAGTSSELVAFVRFTEAEALLTLSELRLVEPWARRHRDLPLGRIENAVNADPQMRFQLVLDMPKQIPNDDLVEFFRAKANVRGSRVRHKLERPAGRRLDDDFYADVARAYADAVHFALNPRKTLAADSGTPADTVARWIREARKRSKLSEGEPGKARGHVVEASAEPGKVST
ncbi:MAG: hypothetical protein ACRDNP_01800 [Gaiellaceae bacterium]